MFSARGNIPNDHSKLPGHREREPKVRLFGVPQHFPAVCYLSNPCSFILESPNPAKSRKTRTFPRRSPSHRSPVFLPPNPIFVFSRSDNRVHQRPSHSRSDRSASFLETLQCFWFIENTTENKHGVQMYGQCRGSSGGSTFLPFQLIFWEILRLI